LPTLAAMAVAVTLGAPAAAQAITYSEGFDADDGGWQILQATDEGSDSLTPEYSASGGNPGGFISYDDVESGPADLQGFFLSPFAVENTDGGGVLSLDLRSDATDLRETGINLIVFNDEDSVSCRMGGPTPSWRTYTVTYDADEPCWLDFDNNDAGVSDLQAAIANSDAPILVSADMDVDFGELTDLDNVAWVGGPDVNDRDLSISYREKTETFSGRITSGDSECEEAETVELYLEKSGGDKRVGTDETSSKGKWTFTKNAKKGKHYYASAPPSADEGVGCREVASKKVKG
jgi:hypothetical protein